MKTDRPRMTENMLAIARINQEARNAGLTYGAYLAGTDPTINNHIDHDSLYAAIHKHLKGGVSDGNK